MRTEPPRASEPEAVLTAEGILEATGETVGHLGQSVSGLFVPYPGAEPVIYVGAPGTPGGHVLSVHRDLALDAMGFIGSGEIRFGEGLETFTFPDREVLLVSTGGADPGSNYAGSWLMLEHGI